MVRTMQNMELLTKNDWQSVDAILEDVSVTEAKLLI